MSKSVINFKVDKEVKEEAQELARQLGIPLSAIVNSQLRQLIRSRQFMLDATPTMTPFLNEVLDQVEKDRKKGKNITRTRSLEEALAHLDSL